MAETEAMDDVAFEAAMTSFLHEFKLATDKVTVMEGDVSPDSHCPQKATLSKLKATERRDRYRKKLRNERETLRRQQRELSMELTRLQEAQAREKELEKARNTFALSAWRATAARQKEKRLEVEHEQQQLKAAVRCRAEVIRRMSAMLRPSAPLKTREVDAQGTLLFKTFIGELELLYDRTDHFMKDSTENVPPENFALIRKWGQDGMVLERANATEIPVAFEPTWRCLSSIFLSDPQGTQYTGEIDDPENTAAITYRLNYGSGDTPQLVIYNAVRRYVEKDRVVFVWRVLFEGQGEFDGLYADEHAWLVIRSSGSGTSLESFSQLKPMRIDGHAVSSDSRSLQFVKLLQKSDEEDIADIKQLIERELLNGPAPSSDVVMELNL